MSGPATLSNSEIDRKSVLVTITSGLNASGWGENITVLEDTNGFPTREQIDFDQFKGYIFVTVSDHKVESIELGSHGKERQVYIHVFAHSDGMKERLAEEITNLLRDMTDVYTFVTGNEAVPELDVAQRIDVSSVGWRNITPIAGAPIEERFRAVVSATLRRTEF